MKQFKYIKKQKYIYVPHRSTQLAIIFLVLNLLCITIIIFILITFLVIMYFRHILDAVSACPIDVCDDYSIINSKIVTEEQTKQ